MCFFDAGDEGGVFYCAPVLFGVDEGRFGYIAGMEGDGRAGDET